MNTNGVPSGVWSVVFGTAKGDTATGVMVLEDERIAGGDSNFYYTGRYHCAGDEITAEVKVAHYGFSTPTLVGPVLRGSTLHLHLRGRWTAESITAEGRLEGARNGSVRCKLTKLEDLPPAVHARG
jgi:hypothetical protein